jgi:hypothetical protein
MRGKTLERGALSRLTYSTLDQHGAEMTAELCGGMQVAFRLYFRGRSLGNSTETRRIHSMSEQHGRGSGNLMGYTPYTAEHYCHVRALPCRIQGQQHGYPYHGKVAMTATLLHETPASTWGRMRQADLSKDFIGL